MQSDSIYPVTGDLENWDITGSLARNFREMIEDRVRLACARCSGKHETPNRFPVGMLRDPAPKNPEP